jgi:hypothetical protein
MARPGVGATGHLAISLFAQEAHVTVDQIPLSRRRARQLELRDFLTMRDDGLIDRLRMSKSTIDAMAKAVPTDAAKAVVGDNYGRWASTPPKPKSVVDESVEKFNPKAD